LNFLRFCPSEKKKNLGEKLWSSGSGRVIMTERLWVQNLHCGDLFSHTIHWDKKYGNKNC
jgi:hypothetical protein